MKIEERKSHLSTRSETRTVRGLNRSSFVSPLITKFISRRCLCRRRRFHSLYVHFFARSVRTDPTAVPHGIAPVCGNGDK